MKASLAALAGTVLLASCPWALAASTVDLAVTGRITPSACTPTLSRAGVIDHGKLSAKDLNPTTYTRLPDSALQMRVTCDAAALFALSGIDNRLGSSNGAHDYGLGIINGKERVGSFTLKLTDTLADGDRLNKLTSFDNGATWIWNDDDAEWMRGWLQAFGSSQNGVWAPVPIKELVSQLIIATWVYATNGMTLIQEQPLDGSATLELRYL